MSNSLGPAFSYSPSPPTRHQPQSSESSFASLSTSSSSTRSSSTSYTSSYCSYEEGEEEEEDDHGSVLEDLYELANVKSDQSPPRFARDSSQQLRERTRYRSSASIHPPAQLVQPSSRPVPNSSMDFAALLASLPPSLDTCFCGQAVEEESIYCSRRCAQEDALNALCGSSGAEDSDRASLVSGSSGSTSQSGESHYRRVEREEVRREKERQAKIARERSAARRKAREGASVSSTGSSGSKKGSLWRSNVDVGSLKTSSSSSSCSRSSRRAETPSLSSSISSLSSTSSPISPSFPPAAVSSQSLSHPNPTILAPTEPPRPTTPSPPSHLQEMNDIYSSYLTSTPLAPSSESKHLRTPTQHFGINSNSTPRSTYPHTPFDEDEDEESPTGRAARLRAEQQGMPANCGVSDVGMRMLQLCSSYPSSPSDDLLSESLDHVQTEAPSLGWGHRDMQERMNRKQPRSGHTKGKLSFEDVVGILGA
ncbi:hypothetical protein JCM5353_002886 [Sporobolomyces roseus]